MTVTKINSKLIINLASGPIVAKILVLFHEERL